MQHEILGFDPFFGFPMYPDSKKKKKLILSQTGQIWRQGQNLTFW